MSISRRGNGNHGRYHGDAATINARVTIAAVKGYLSPILLEPSISSMHPSSPKKRGIEIKKSRAATRRLFQQNRAQDKKARTGRSMFPAHCTARKTPVSSRSTISRSRSSLRRELLLIYNNDKPGNRQYRQLTARIIQYCAHALWERSCRRHGISVVSLDTKPGPEIIAQLKGLPKYLNDQTDQSLISFCLTNRREEPSMSVVVVVGAQWGDEGKERSSTILRERQKLSPAIRET